MVNQTISKLSTQHTFSASALGVVPGRVYDGTVTVHSGPLGSTAHCYVHLGVLIYFFMCFTTEEKAIRSESICGSSLWRQKKNRIHFLSLWLSPHSAPRAVQQLVIRHIDETSLSVQWKQLAGEWSSFTLLLSRVNDFDSGVTTIAQRDLTREAMDCTFNFLTPGLLYTVTVATNSGNLSSSASVSARTSTFVFILLLIEIT